MMKQVSAILVALSLLASFHASASEPSRDLVRERAVKQAVVEAIQNRIERHRAMPVEEIRAELIQSLEANRIRMGATDVMAQAIDQHVAAIPAMDKDSLLALEEAQLQSTLSSGLYLFAITVMMYLDGSERDRMTLFYIGLPIYVALDLALLPVEIILSLVLE